MVEKPRILAVIPCLNEEATIGSVILKTIKYVDSVLVIDDGSIDNTISVAEAAGATVICHDYNKGKAAGIRAGFKYTLENDFDIVVTLDGDGQHDADEIPKLLEPLLKGEVDMAIGFRFGQTTEIPFWRKMGKRTLDYATGIGTTMLTDSQCGFRAFSRKAIRSISRQLRGNGFSIESEQLMLATDNDVRIAEVKVSCRYDNLKTSKKSPLTHGPSVLGYIIWLVAERRPLLFIGIPGIILIVIGVFFGIHTIRFYNQNNSFLLSYALGATVFLILGSLAVLMSILLNILPHIIQRAREG